MEAEERKALEEAVRVLTYLERNCTQWHPFPGVAYWTGYREFTLSCLPSSGI